MPVDKREATNQQHDQNQQFPVENSTEQVKRTKRFWCKFAKLTARKHGQICASETNQKSSSQTLYCLVSSPPWLMTTDRAFPPSYMFIEGIYNQIQAQIPAVRISLNSIELCCFIKQFFKCWLLVHIVRIIKEISCRKSHKVISGSVNFCWV